MLPDDVVVDVDFGSDPEFTYKQQNRIATLPRRFYLDFFTEQ